MDTFLNRLRGGQLRCGVQRRETKFLNRLRGGQLFFAVVLG